MDYFALFDTKKIIGSNKMKKKVISKKEYVKICLECPYKRCHGSYNGCERTKPYRTIKGEDDEKKD